MVKPWEDATGATMKYTGTRDLNTVLTTGIASGVLPGYRRASRSGTAPEFATGGSLKPLDDVLDIATYKSETAPALVSLGNVDNKIYGVFIKAAVKGLMWYNPKVRQLCRQRAGHVGRFDGGAEDQRQARPRRSGASASSRALPPGGRAPTGSRTSSCASQALTSTTSGGRAR